MNRSVLFLQVGVVLVVAAWLGTTSPQELLPDTESAARFQVGIDHMSQSGGCWLQNWERCPQVGSAQSELCNCTGPSDINTCTPQEAVAETDPDWAIPYLYMPEPNRNLQWNFGGYGSSRDVRVFCAILYYCTPICRFHITFARYTCPLKHISEDQDVWSDMRDGQKVNTDDPVWCNFGIAQRTPESLMQMQVATANGMSIRLFSAE